jgi:hypothetical protein
MAKASYMASPPQLIDGWSLIASTPTLKFYRSDNTIVVAIRGTNPSDRRDLEADAKIALNKLETTPRYQTDRSTLLKVMRQFPTAQFEYYGVGHSLGGAILDAFIKEGWIRNGISYNPAVQPKNLDDPIPNQRIYQSGDPLYQIFGRFTPNAEVRPPRKPTALESLVRKIPYVGSMFGLYKDHQLDNFEGGGKTHRENVLKKYGLKEDGYSVAELAKITGVPEATLQEVYNRGIGAYKTNPTSVRMKGSFRKDVDAPMSQKLSKEQWAMARVYSFLDGNPKHDSDLRGGAKKKRVLIIDVDEPLPKKAFTALMKGTSREERLGRLKRLLPQTFSAEQWAKFCKKVLGFKTKVVDDDVELVKVEPTDYGFFETQLRADGTKSGEVPTEISGWKELEGSGSAEQSRFLRELKEIGLTPTAYLREARRRAKRAGYDPRRLKFAEDGVHKLAMTDEKGATTKFGRVGYKDHLMWSHLERQGSVERGTAEAKQQRFQKSHRAMKGDWKNNPYSANRLALAVLW